MGGTFDEVPRIDPRVSTTFGSGKLEAREPAHARCWVLRDRMRESATNLRTFSDAGSAGCGEGTARTLRTTQWTRASLNRRKSVQKDDLKDH